MPVLETLGGALFGAVLQVLFDKLDSHQILDYFRGRKFDDKLLKKLKRKLVTINAVIDDAELKQFSNAYLKAWLDDVRDVLLDTEDLLDEIHYEINRSELEDDESQISANKVCNFESRIIEVLDDLESLSNQKEDLGLKITVVGVGSGSGSIVSHRVPSTSSVAENVIYGRDDDKEMILKWLTSDTKTDKHSQLSILSLVGMGGMGKTTLAQHAYNDPRMEEGKFDIKAWVCVSDKFDVFTLTKVILEAITKLTDDSSNLEMVQGRLKEKLATKKFLLVLDDVWNEDRDQWKALQNPLNYGAEGSKILVTTRNNEVASTIHSNEVRQLKQLQEDHSWKVFAKHAFRGDVLHLNDELKKIGEKIVQRCQGLPLALETIGSLLYTKSSISEWENVLMSEIWELPTKDSKIIPALLLSYYHLPSHLKRCFSYCALFPKDYEFDKKSLILLWMSENLLKFPRHSKSLEEVGEEYFEDLLSRCFFEESSRDDETYFFMHDLLNDLAKYVSGDICFRFGIDKPHVIPQTRHFSFLTDADHSHGFGGLFYAERLRTFLPTSRRRYINTWVCKINIEELVSKFKFLRVLSLFGCYNLETVPNSVSELKHLCSLDLSKTQIKKLPDLVCFLYNLQILKLNDCSNLKELPSTLYKLTKLRCLEFIRTKVRKMPMHMEKLKNLNVLTSFYVGKGSEFGIQQLRELNFHGSLLIGDLQNILNPLDALAADLKNKAHLVELDLEWNLKENPDDSMKEREILENLQPSKYLRELSIKNYGGTQFASWLSNDSLSNVVSISLEKCKCCLFLPPLGLLPCLKELSIRALDGIVVISAEFFGSNSSSFTSLETLRFYNMKEWEEWECRGMIGAFPHLQSLFLGDCPKLKGYLPEQLCNLKDLTIIRCEQLGVSGASTLTALEIRHLHLENCEKLQIDHPTTLESLTLRGHNMEASLLERRIGGTYSCVNNNIPMDSGYDFLVWLDINRSCDSLTTCPLDFFPKLNELHLSCRNLQMISQGHTHNHLKHLYITECPHFESFPSDGLSIPCLWWFEIRELGNLKSLPNHMHDLLPSLFHLWIHDCPQVELSSGGFPANLKEMSLSNCSKLIASLKGSWGVNPSLQSLSIRKVDVKSFPDEELLPSSLTKLCIYECPDLKKLDYKGLCQLSSLQTLILSDCPSLQCLPEESLPKSISHLDISGNCPLLKQRCQKQEGEDWAKIAHIQTIRIDGKRIN